jgi:hypothetical protein
VDNPESFGVGGLKIGIDVTVGIHHERLATRRAANEIADLGELGLVEAFENHSIGLLAMGYGLWAVHHEESSSGTSKKMPCCGQEDKHTCWHHDP